MQNVKTYVIANDLMLASQVPPATMERSHKIWKPWFCPREFVKDNKGIRMEHYQLSQTQLKSWGTRVSLLRKSYRAFAESMLKKLGQDQSMNMEEINEAIRKVRARGAVRKGGMTLDELRDFQEPVAAGSRKRKRKRNTLTISNKMNIVHQVIV